VQLTVAVVAAAASEEKVVVVAAAVAAHHAHPLQIQVAAVETAVCLLDHLRMVVAVGEVAVHPAAEAAAVPATRVAPAAIRSAAGARSQLTGSRPSSFQLMPNSTQAKVLT
jgi:hypothetical protein